MKRLILSVSIAAVFAACSNPKTAEVKEVKQQPDTSGLAAFNQWKEQQSNFNMEGVQDVQTQPVAEQPVQQQQVQQQAQPRTVVVYRDAPAKKKAVVPVKQERTYAKSSSPVRESKSRNSSSSQSTSSGDNSSAGAGSGTVGTGTGAGTEDIAKAPEAEKKEGWSKAAKGTAIGGASGAVLGAIISKNKTKGAVIGGVVGAAGGYILGRKQDKKDGRY